MHGANSSTCPRLEQRWPVWIQNKQHANFVSFANSAFPAANVDALNGLVVCVVPHHQSGVPVQLAVKFAATCDGVIQVRWKAPGRGVCVQYGLMLDSLSDIRLWPQEDHGSVVGAILLDVVQIKPEWGLSTLRAIRASPCARSRWSYLFCARDAPSSHGKPNFSTSEVLTAPTRLFHGVAGLPARVLATHGKHRCAQCGELYTSLEAWVASCAPDASETYRSMRSGLA